MIRQRQQHQQRGFGTIEVLVTLLLLSVGMIPLFEAMTNLQRNAFLLRRAEQHNVVILSAMDYFSGINVGVRPKGQENFGRWEMEWSAELLDEDVAFSLPGLQRTRGIALYDVDLVLSYRLDGEEVNKALKLRAIGWQDGVTRNVQDLL